MHPELEVNGTCILVFGVSGVGKTRACKDFVARNPNFIFVTASDLLKQAKGLTAEQLRTADSEEILHNQRILTSEFERFRFGRERQPILVDAHGVVDNDRTLIFIPVDTVRSFKPDGLILLEASAATVAKRRLDDYRHRPLRKEAELALEIEAEHAAVAEYARALGLPFEATTVDDDFSLDVIVEQIIRTVQGVGPSPFAQ